MAPVEMMKFAENQEWAVIEMSEPSPLPYVGMRLLSLEDRPYIVGGLPSYQVRRDIQEI